MIDSTGSASALCEILFTYQNFKRAQNTQQDARLVHVTDNFWDNDRVQLLACYGELMHHLIVL